MAKKFELKIIPRTRPGTRAKLIGFLISDLYFPLSQICYHNLKQGKNRSQTDLKHFQNLTGNLIHHNAYMLLNFREV